MMRTAYRLLGLAAMARAVLRGPGALARWAVRVIVFRQVRRLLP